MRTLAPGRTLGGMRLALAFAAALWVLSGTALAGENPEKPEVLLDGTTAEPAVSAGGMTSGMEGRRPTDVLRFDPLLIEGRVQKPQAVHLLQRQAPAFVDLIPEDPFLTKILDALESEPF